MRPRAVGIAAMIFDQMAQTDRIVAHHVGRTSTRPWPSRSPPDHCPWRCRLRRRSARVRPSTGCSAARNRRSRRAHRRCRRSCRRRNSARSAPMHHDDAAGHVFAAMVADALDHRHGARVAHGETLAADAAEIAFSLDRAVQHRIADNDVVLGDALRVGRRHDDDAPARQALADIIVGLAGQLKRNAVRQECAEALPGAAGELDDDGVIGQSGMAMAFRHFARQHGAERCDCNCGSPCRSAPACAT